ncbi:MULTISPECIES: heavy-metal-associated domain-containing protein [Gulbenkiania]|uniref:Copper chaperone CopZ n=2 Tax=Gulbenkiania TaxID=397456 RepID=A0A0K6GTU3_9NEIS|nr:MULTISPECIES: cation transporter [Gulbenkiania]TCW33760.1 copper chaperone [Gulbenkiania mobilis]CUA82131.1 Copper chaperone CopZ [Gulbenkiania indica]
MIEMTMSVRGMTCVGCVNSVNEVLNRIEGVESAEVNLQTASARVCYDESRVAPDALLQAVNDAGFEASSISA